MKIFTSLNRKFGRTGSVLAGNAAGNHVPMTEVQRQELLARLGK